MVVLRIPRFRRREGADPAPFVVASPRSGTTLLRMMLDAHPRLAIPPETHFLPELISAIRDGLSTPEEVASLIAGHRRWADFHLDEDQLVERLQAAERLTATSALRAFYSLYAERQGKPRWGDKTPEYVLAMREIQGVLPEARFVHVIRDGRDVALSRLRWRARRRSDPPPPIGRLARRWRRWITRARRQARRIDHYLEVRYEDLVLDTEATLGRICEFIELEWDPAVLAYHSRAQERLEEIAHTLPAAGGRHALQASERLTKHEMTTRPPSKERVAVWREEMSPADRATFEAEAGELLSELGYPTGEEA